MSLNKPCRIAASTNRTYLDPSKNIQTIADLNTFWFFSLVVKQKFFHKCSLSLKFCYCSCTAQCISSIPCYCSSLPCVNVWSITHKSCSREQIWIEAGNRGRKSVLSWVSYKYSPAKGLMKIVKNQFFVYWAEFHILDSLFLKVYRVLFN